MKPNPDVVNLAAGVVSQADREHPADAVLRHELKARRGLTRAVASEVSRAVFAFYRWRARSGTCSTEIPKAFPTQIC